MVAVRLDQINIVVHDMDAMGAFYQRLGVSFGAPDREWDAHHRSAMDQGGAHLDLDSQPFTRVWNHGWPGGPGAVLGFRVDTREDVDRLYDELTSAGHQGQQEPWDAFWGARYAVVTDPDGNAVGLMSPVDPARRTPGPPPPDTARPDGTT